MADGEGRDGLRIGLLWHSTNSGNLGVGALTVANMLLASKAAERAGFQPNFTIVGFRDRAAEYVTSAATLRITGRSVLDPRGYWSELGRFDCLLDIGGGDSFTDIYGAKRFAYLWLTKAQAISKGKPLLLSPQTIGPFKGQPYRKLAGSVLARADAVFARDDMSMAAIRKLAPRARAFQSVDVAFALPYTPAERSPGRVRIGLNVSGLLFNNTLEKTAKGALSYDYAELARRLVESLTADSRNQVELICHVSAPEQPNDDDGAVADRIAREFPAVMRVPGFSSPSEAKSYISGLNFLVGGRMHACIAAYSAKVPFVATAYSRKFTGLFGMLEYPAVLPQHGIGVDEAITFVLDALASREQLGMAIAAGTHKIERLLDCYESELVTFFSKSAAKAKLRGR